MSYVYQVSTIPISAITPTNNLGISACRYGALTLDEYLPGNEVFKYIGVSVAGDISVERVDGVVVTFPVTPGIIPCMGYRVLTSGTTATGFAWYGGMLQTEKG